MAKEKLQLNEIELYSLDDINYLKEQLKIKDREIESYIDEISSLNEKLSKRIYNKNTNENDREKRKLQIDNKYLKGQIQCFQDSIMEQRKQMTGLQITIVKLMEEIKKDVIPSDQP